MKKTNNITLIGMPGSGKTTIGKKLAKKLKFEFLDSDKYIEKKEKMTLQKIIDKGGDEIFCNVEEKRISELLPLKNQVLAPGGSVVYSRRLMRILKSSSLVVFLELPLKIIEKRLKNKSKRGIVGLKLKMLKEIYEERTPFYKTYADAIVDCSEKSDSQVVKEIIKIAQNEI